MMYQINLISVNLLCLFCLLSGCKSITHRTENGRLKLGQECKPMPMPQIIAPNVGEVEYEIPISALGDFEGNYAKYKLFWSIDGVEIGNKAETIYTPVHNGTQMIKLAVMDCSGLRVTRKELMIVSCMLDMPPKIAFAEAPDTVFVNQLSSFSARADFAGTNYSWDFGDGARATTASASHVFTRAGTYTVKLKASTVCMSEIKEFRVKVKANSCLVFNSVFFPYNEATLSEEALQRLQENVDEYQLNCPYQPLKIIAATYFEKNEENLLIQRQNAIIDFYTKKGINPNMLFKAKASPLISCDKDLPGGCRRAYFGMTSKY